MIAIADIGIGVKTDTTSLQCGQQQLENLGNQVLTATTKAPALALLAETEIDLLLTNMLISEDMGGRELADVARQISLQLSGLYTSAYVASLPIVKGKLDSDEPFLSKPYDPTKLAQKIQTLLAETRS